jgi:hypothetical protein
MIHNFKKYEPEKFSDFVGNKIISKSIYDKLKNKCCKYLVIGPSGCGKTLLCNLILKCFEYDVLYINGGEVDDVKSFKRLLENFKNNKTILSFMSKKHKVIFIDDIDILLSCDRNANSFIQGFIDNISKNKLEISCILTCCTSEEKRVTELKKKLECLKINNPNRKDVYVYISNILEKENIDYNVDTLFKLIDAHNNNIRNILNNIHQLDFNDDNIDIVRQEKVLFDSNIFDIMMKLFKRKMNLFEIRQISDNSLASLLIYENYLNEMSKNRLKKKRDIYFDVITNINENFIDSDIIEYYMYHNSEWDLHDMVTFLRCCPINWHLDKFEKRKFSTFHNYVFSQILTKNALRCNFGKKLTNMKSNIQLQNTDQIYYIFDIISIHLNSPDVKIGQEKKLIKSILNLTDDDISIMYQYFSQFLTMDKSQLSKIKKA